MQDWIETHRGAVLASEYDPRTYMNTQMYVSRFDQATWYLLSTIGQTPEAMRRRGRRLAVVRQALEFKAELKGGELIVINSGFLAVGEKALRFVHRMVDSASGNLIATADFTAVEADLENGKSRPLPQDVHDAASRHVVTRSLEQ